MSETVVFFRQYPFMLGQKIHIEDGPRKGDWLVSGFDDKKITLRCPVSGVEVSWANFCYFTEEKEAKFPAQDNGQNHFPSYQE